MTFPSTLIEIAVEPKSLADQQKLIPALVELATADADLGFYIDHESGQTILQAMSEQHLDATLDVLIRERGIGMNVGAPQVAYRETISRRAEIDHTYRRQMPGAGQFARVKLVFEPGEPGSGFVFESAIADGALPQAYVAAAEKGLQAASENGLIAGFPVIELKATLVDGAYHDIDSSALVFEIAARAAFRELREKGGPRLLEPVMAVEVVTPEQYLGSVIADLHGHRGRIRGQAIRGDAVVVDAFVPLSSMLGYGWNLQGMTQGRASFAMSYDHYAEVPRPLDPDDNFPPAVGMRA